LFKKVAQTLYFGIHSDKPAPRAHKCIPRHQTFAPLIGTISNFPHRKPPLNSQWGAKVWFFGHSFLKLQENTCYFLRLVSDNVLVDAHKFARQLVLVIG
jgi:hypothetical protein